MTALKYFTIFLFLCLFSETDSKYVEGTIDTSNTGQNWVFLSRFCFLSQKGMLDYQFEYPVEYGTEMILLYYDEPGQWEAVYETDKNCSAKVSVLSVSNNQIIGLDDTKSQISFYSGCKIVDKQGYKFYNCSGTRTFRSSRERWWFIALARCEPAAEQRIGLKLDYKIHMTNGDEDEFLTYEYSADEFYIFPVDVAFLIAYLFMLTLSIVCAVYLRNGQLFHTTYKMYMVSLGLWTFSLFLLSVGYGIYGGNGYPQPNTILTARIFGAASLIIFLLMLILMAKGYTITRGRLSQQGSIKITIFTCLYVVVYAVLFIWEAEFFDPGKVLYLYDSPPGYGLIAMRLIGWVWFLYAIFFTLKNYPTKGAFYYPLFFFYTVWFWAGPIIIVTAQHALDLWAREKTVNGVEQLVALLGHLFFLILTRPGAANKNFPYHVRTSQIGVLGEDNMQQTAQQTNNINSTNMEYPYSRTSNQMVNGTGPDLTGLFVVSQTYSDRPIKTESETEIKRDIPPVLQGKLPPIVPSAPPSYEALFTVGGHSSTNNNNK